MRIYLDVCCLRRLEDDKSQSRVRLEGDAVEVILTKVAAGEWEWVSSHAVDGEARARELVREGFGAMDAVHLSCAESAGVDVFLTTDDGLLRRSRKRRLKIRVENPLNWLSEVMP